MSDRLTLFSSQRNGAHEVLVYSEGVLVAGPLAATQVLDQLGVTIDYTYYVDLPATIPAGYYDVQMRRTSDGRQRGNVGLQWTGTDIVRDGENELTIADLTAAVAGLATTAQVNASQAAIVANTDAAESAVLAGQAASVTAINTNAVTLHQTTRTQIIAAITAAQATILADITDAENLITAAINGLNNITVAQIEAALINDGDGQAFRAALAQSIEQAIANAADGEDTIALFQGAVASALTAYNAATQADVTTSTAATAAAITAAQTALQADIAAIDVAGDVAVALAAYGAATLTDVNAARDDVLNGIALLEDLSAADVAAELATYDAATAADLAAAVTTLQSTQGLSVAQAATLTFIRDVLEADEDYQLDAAGVGTAQKLLKGTSTVLVSKTVASAPACEQSTQITEV